MEMHQALCSHQPIKEEVNLLPVLRVYYWLNQAISKLLEGGHNYMHNNYHYMNKEP